MMLPTLQIGPIALPLPALIILAGIWFSLDLIERGARLQSTESKHVYDLAFVALIAGLITARLSYMLQYPSAFIANPLSILSINSNLLDLFGGGAGALIAMLIFIQRKSMSFWDTLDSLTPGLAFFTVALPLANFASGTAFGAPTTLPWGVPLWGAMRHPVQIYQALTSLGILWYVWPGRLKVTFPKGGLFFRFTAMSAATRLFLEAFRGDSILIINGIRLPQVIAWLILAASFWVIHKMDVPDSSFTNAKVS
jgi:prolipoprotein diacylglyceryl transferase